MIPIYKPFMPDNLMAGLEEILYSGKLSFGRYGLEFERKLAGYVGSKYVLTIGSYNHAMLVVISTLGLKPGDEVIASPVSCLASNQPLIVKGVRVVWADIDPLYGTLSVDDVRARITSKTKAIFHNHFCGYLGDIEGMNALGREFGIPIVDDCIEAFASVLNGRKVGNLGTDISVFSFQTVRLPNTIEGGAIVFSNSEMYEKAKLIRDYGIDRSNFRDALNEINPDFDIKVEGYGALMGEINSHIGIKQLEHLDSLIEQQRSNAVLWNERFQEHNKIDPLSVLRNSKANYWVFGVLVRNKYDAIKQFRKQGYYATSVHINNNRYSIFNNKTNLPGVNQFVNSFVALPCGWWFDLSE
ncbi:DegT/DnrJ/EryC1/StrS aminotransferase family protein [Schleiferiaceae bacterium]|nr:DegT/DnrJ/EryC1/StrS aminotransferase family protein [Schleiferiaceae bacterium]